MCMLCRVVIAQMFAHEWAVDEQLAVAITSLLCTLLCPQAIFRSRKIFQRMRNYCLYRISCTIQLLVRAGCP